MIKATKRFVSALTHFTLLISVSAFLAPQAQSKSDVIKKDGDYLLYANGIVKDTKTGLEWKAGPDRDMNWNQAGSWVQSLNLDGGGWRMPTMDELEGLYKKGAGNRNMTPLLKTTIWYVWSGETHGQNNSTVAGFFRFNAAEPYWSYSFYKKPRAFAVRSRGDG